MVAFVSKRFDHSSLDAVSIGVEKKLEALLTKTSSLSVLFKISFTASFIEFSLPKFVRDMRENQSDLGLVCTEVDDLSRFGAANIEQGKLIGFSEKGKSGKGFINAGIYWLNTSHYAFLGQPERFSFEKNVLANKELNINVFKTKGLFFDIGTPGDFAGAQRLVELNQGLFSTSPKIVKG